MFLWFFNEPLVTVSIKMLLVLLILQHLDRWRLNAQNKARLWQIGLLFLTTLPLMHWLMPSLSIPLLPLTNHLEIPLMGSTKLIELGQISNGSGAFAISLVVLVVLVSIVLVVITLWRLYKINIISQRAEQLRGQRFQRVFDQAINQIKPKQRVQVRLSKEIQTPCTWGIFRPVILVPVDIIDSKTLKVILLHELAHIKRNDWLWLILSQLMTALCWFNPLILLAQKRMLNHCESACDELVLQQPIQSSFYAKILLNFHQRNSPRMALVTNMAQTSVMYQRLHQILNPRRNTMKKNQQSWLIVSLLPAFLLLSVVQVTAAHQENYPQTDGLSTPPLPAKVAPQAENTPTEPVAEKAPAAEPQPEFPVKSASPVMPSSPVAKPTQVGLERPRPEVSEVERVRYQEARIKAAEFRARKEERDMNREQLRLERNMSHLEQQRARTIASQQKIKELRQRAEVQQLRSKELETKARMARIKALENQPDPINNSL